MSGHPQDFSLREQARLVATGELDPHLLLQATLDRIAERDGALRSVITTFPGESRQMLDEAPRGPLYGVPITMKDMYCLPWRGLHNGSLIERMPPQASGAFERLRDAGAVVVAVANQHLLGAGTTGAESAYGPQANPWNTSRCAGGSSGGSAAGVAARLVGGSVGSDSGGSTRCPATYCGVVGLKLTFRSLPYHGYIGVGTLLSAPGAFGRDAADTRLLASALLGRDLAAASGSELRIGLLPALWDDLDPEVEAACRAALDAAAWRTREVDLPGLGLIEAISLALFRGGMPGLPSGPALAALPQRAQAKILANAAIPAWAVARADRVRAMWRRELKRLASEFDLFACPTSPAVAPPLDDPFVTLPRRGRIHADDANRRQTPLANATGCPAISVPVGFDAAGLPIGLQLIAPWGKESVLLDAAEHIERATGRRFVDAIPEMAR